jgi:UDP-glucose 4-epimerase
MGNYLVTGGCGFIGSHLVGKLLSFDNNVFIIDNLFSGNIQNLESYIDRHLWQSLENLSRNSKDKKYILSDRLVLYKCNISDKISIFKSFEDMDHLDFVFNLAAIVSVPYSIKHEEETIDINFYGVKNITKTAREFGARGIIQAGSSAEYGECKILPIKEEYATSSTVHLSPYGRSKYLATSFLLDSFFGDFETIVLRFFNVYGPRQDPKSPYSGVISRFLDFVKNREDITIFGNGCQSRDFVYVNDVIDSCLCAAGVYTSDKSKCLENNSGVFNVGSGSSVTINELADLIINFSNSKSDVVYLPPRVGDILHSCASIEKAVNILGWRPHTPLEKGLSLTHLWYGN